MLKIISHWPKAGEHLIVLALAWGGFSVIFGLIGAFNEMEISGEKIASQAIFGAMKTAGLMVIGGFTVFSVPLAIARLSNKEEQKFTEK